MYGSRYHFLNLPKIRNVQMVALKFQQVSFASLAGSLLSWTVLFVTVSFQSPFLAPKVPMCRRKEEGKNRQQGISTFTFLKSRKSNRLEATLVTFTYAKKLAGSHIPHLGCLIS